MQLQVKAAERRAEQAEARIAEYEASHQALKQHIRELSDELQQVSQLLSTNRITAPRLIDVLAYMC